MRKNPQQLTLRNPRRAQHQKTQLMQRQLLLKNQQQLQLRNPRLHLSQQLRLLTANNRCVTGSQAPDWEPYPANSGFLQWIARIYSQPKMARIFHSVMDFFRFLAVQNRLPLLLTLWLKQNLLQTGVDTG
jgi:hypothetical protein